MNLEVWSMECPMCGEDMVPIFVGVQPPLLSRWACNACGNSVSPNEALDEAARMLAGEYCEGCEE